ncbi:MAG: AsmA family protein [Nitrospirae bacterium]|nr:AsmA family protein [Nitrospirota bacterium]
MKKTLYIAGGIAGAVILAAVIFVLTLDINSYKPRIEAAASETSGLQVAIGGKMRLTVFPDIGASLEGLSVKNKGADVFSAKEVSIGVELMPLLHKEVKVKSIEVVSPDVNVVKDRNGRYNFEALEKNKGEKEAAPDPFRIASVSVKDGHIVYRDLKSGGKYEVSKCDIGMDGLTFVSGDAAKTVSFDGDISCGAVSTKDMAASDISASLKARAGDIEGELSCGKVSAKATAVSGIKTTFKIEGGDLAGDITVKDVTNGKLKVSDISAAVKSSGKKYVADGINLKLFGGTGTGSVKADMTGKTPAYTVDFKLAGLRVEETLAAFDKKQSMRGPLDLTARLALNGKTARDFERTARGEFSVRGRDLAIQGMDLDAVLDKYEKSQSVSLYDVGSAVILGPLGPLLTKGFDFGGVYKESLGGATTVRVFVSDWKVGGGAADAADVAFSTKRNRVAMKGRLNLVEERYENVRVAVLDKEGHATFTQRIQGDFRRPQVEKISAFKAVLGSVLGLFEKTKNLFVEEKREVFYDGSVKHPR